MAVSLEVKPSPLSSCVWTLLCLSPWMPASDRGCLIPPLRELPLFPPPPHAMRQAVGRVFIMTFSSRCLTQELVSEETRSKVFLDSFLFGKFPFPDVAVVAGDTLSSGFFRARKRRAAPFAVSPSLAAVPSETFPTFPPETSFFYCVLGVS